MAVSIVSTQDAENYLRLETGQDSTGVETARLAAQRQVEVYMNRHVLDAVLHRRYSPLPRQEDSVMVIPLADVQTVVLDRAGLNPAMNEASSVSRVSGNVPFTYVYPPTGGWTITDKDDFHEVTWSIGVGVESDKVKETWKQACLILIASYYDDRLGQVAPRTVKAARSLLSGDVVRHNEELPAPPYGSGYDSLCWTRDDGSW